MTRWIEQPANTVLCGQIAVAVVAGVSLEQAIAAVGHERRTKTRHLAEALRSFGFSCPDKCRRMSKPPPIGIGQLRYPGGKDWHWIVVRNGRTYDGAFGTSAGRVLWPRGLRVTSWLPIEEPA